MTETEKEVGDFLKDIGIWWRFEKPLFTYDEADRPRIWTPDFYLPDIGVHVEVCGSEDFDYDYREKIYHKNECCVIFVHHYKDKESWKFFLLQRLKEIQEIRNKEISTALNLAIEKKHIKKPNDEQ